MYGFIMSLVASDLGNNGEYEISDDYNRRIIEGCMHFHRLKVLPSVLNDRLWNDSQRKECGIPSKISIDELEELDQIIALSDLDGQEARTDFYRAKRLRVLEKRT